MSDLDKRVKHLEKLAAGQFVNDFEIRRYIISRTNGGPWEERLYSISGPCFRCLAEEGEDENAVLARVKDAKRQVAHMAQRLLYGTVRDNEAND